MSGSPSAEDREQNIRINQIGYPLQGAKIAIVVNTDSTEFVVIDALGEIVYQSTLSDEKYWDGSGEKVRQADFSEVVLPGEYRLAVGNEVSYPFTIANDIYQPALVAATRSYYLHRSGVELEAAYAGPYARPADTMYDRVKYHSSSGVTEGYRSSKGGWYDAGDYGKYVVNAAVSVSTMLHLYELYPNQLADGTLNIPESGNGINDLLDELRFELDWMLTMQDKDGGVFHKVTALSFEGFVMPHDVNDQRYIIGKSTNASVVFAGTLAQAARVFKDIDEKYADRLLNSATAAWDWATEHPEELLIANPDDVRTGVYGSGDLKGEFFWAAAEFYITTKQPEFEKQLQRYWQPLEHALEESWRTYYPYLAYYSLANHDVQIKDKKIHQQVVQMAESRLLELEKNPYRISINHFVWGSNSDILNQAMLFQMAHHISGRDAFLNASYEMLDYLFGKNAVGYSFLSGFGHCQVMDFHHRLAQSDDVGGMIPGFVAGGPNLRAEDRDSLASGGVTYASEFPAKMFIDHIRSFASNEVCINWNAPAVFCLGYAVAISQDVK